MDCKGKVNGMNRDSEDWTDIYGFEGRYQANSNGKIRSIRYPSKRLMKGCINNNGYRNYELDGKLIGGHRLVLLAFVGVPPNQDHLWHGAHKNGVRDDNRLSNLYWSSATKNNRDKIRHGTHQTGELHGRHKLKEDEVREIRRRYEEGTSTQELATEYNVTKGTIERCVSKVAKLRTWQYLDNYSLSEGAKALLL